jgi:hypothetical protein
VRTKKTCFEKAKAMLKRKEAKGSQEEGQETGKAAENDREEGAGARRI